MDFYVVPLWKSRDFCAISRQHKLRFVRDFELESFLQDKLASFKIPSIIQIGHEELPRVASGKFSKTQLRDIFVSIEKNQS